MTEWKTLSGEPPIVIAHRGASGVLPEHTIAAYYKAIQMGADYIEPDLVITKDGHLVARHDRYLSGSTDISDRPEFADRKRTDPSREGEDWFIEDFTLAEIKTLKARQPRAGRTKAYDGLYDIPTFDEVLALVKVSAEIACREIGVYPETKHPDIFDRVGLRHDEAMLDALTKHGFSGADAPVFIQSFEIENLKRLKEKTDIKLVFLTDKKPDFSEIAKTVDGVGPYKELLIDEEAYSTGFIEEAHAAGLLVHPWTFRDDDPAEGFNHIGIELEVYYRYGVDGVFSDFTDTAFEIRQNVEDTP